MRLRHQEESHHVDMTPMLDIVFIMLIFFIVTTSFVKESSVELLKSSRNHQENIIEEKSAVLVIQIDELDGISVAGQMTDIDALQARIEGWKANKRNPTIIVKVHENTSTQGVLSAMDAARSAKIEQVSVTLES
ncbi:biopolymer transporter ExbD [Pleionea sp. CnH1-48]|uniref:ExbD/TolR family protein n=1 Tax=Pleionea sp. CnH1-48 TaxID=2954494 RepID=UPI0020975F57|nr:biopolymer transporter ExbD [Pleionea sp. CnH1-48]MCO7227361.1 biopolymer transporter ExbD [Pleionea sp. CnH1-48]